jgi:NAD(P)-dependent dehydrogenase (short-subunit alcohol dehydrogenase family)
MRLSLFLSMRLFFLSIILFTETIYSMKSVLKMAVSDSLKGKSYLITGSTDGIGEHTAMKLAGMGAKILLHGRDPLRLQRTTEKILDKFPEAELTPYLFDLSTTKSTKAFVHSVLNTNEHLDGLINNAGIFTSKFVITEDGLESTFAINVVAPYIIACLLLPLLRTTKNSRVLNISSTSQGGALDLNNLQFEKGSFSSHKSYSNSKLYMSGTSSFRNIFNNLLDFVFCCCIFCGHIHVCEYISIYIST